MLFTILSQQLLNPFQMNRRKFIKSTSAAGVFTLGFASSHFQAIAKASESPAGIGMCDWNLGGSASYDIIAMAKKVNLQGIQVSIGTDPTNIPLRSQKIRQEYIDSTTNAIGFELTNSMQFQPPSVRMARDWPQIFGI